MSMMRYTIVDQTGTISFPGPPHALKALAAVCSDGAGDHVALLTSLSAFDASLSTAVLDGLAVFDEHVVADNLDSLGLWLADQGPDTARPFRVLDAVTRRLSLEPGRLGVVIFNLKDRRIVQIQNSYAELLRDDRGRIRIDGKPTRQYFRYSLPSEWAILP